MAPGSVVDLWFGSRLASCHNGSDGPRQHSLHSNCLAVAKPTLERGSTKSHAASRFSLRHNADGQVDSAGFSR